MVVSPKLIGVGLAAALGLVTTFDSYYTISSGQVGYARYMGSASKTAILYPGPHFKVPFITTVDKIDVTQKTAHIEPFKVKTADNQMIDIKVNVTYVVPEASAYHILYEIGTPGDNDISDNIAPIVRDRAGQIFSSQNTVTISTDRVAVQNHLTELVHNELNRLFRVDVASLQIESIGYSKAFEESNDKAVLAKNEAILQENRKRVFEFQAAQQVIEAKGQADKAIEDARGKATSAKLAADGQAYQDLTIAKAKAEALVTTAKADKEASTLRGAGEASALSAIVAAVGGPEKYVTKIQAEAAKNWNGTVPTYVVSDRSPTSFFPLPALGNGASVNLNAR